MYIHDSVDLEKSLQTPRPESPFQVGDSQLKSNMELAKKCDAEIQLPNTDSLTNPPTPPPTPQPHPPTPHPQPR